jgi:hypothetical protein
MYLSNISSPAIHSFSILLAITLEYVFRIQRWTPIACNLRRPSNTASYSALLLLHLSASPLKYSLAAYFSLIPEREFNIAAALAPKTPQAPSQYICHIVLLTVPLV